MYLYEKRFRNDRHCVMICIKSRTTGLIIRGPALCFDVLFRLAYIHIAQHDGIYDLDEEEQNYQIPIKKSLYQIA